MKEFGGWFFPDDEAHFPEWMAKANDVVDGRHRYQGKKIDAALALCKNFRAAVDVGGHIGTWSYFLAKRFAMVRTFEPVEAFRDCFARNVIQRNCMLYPFALGAGDRSVHMVIDPKDTGGTHVDPKCDGDIQMLALDRFSFKNIDFIKIDCEGYEAGVIEGGRETITRCKPVIIVEQKQRKLKENFGISGTPAVDMLVGMGYKVRTVISGDYILTS